MTSTLKGILASGGEHAKALWQSAGSKIKENNLFDAVKAKRLDKVKKIFEGKNPPDINCRTSNGWTPLHRALAIGDLSIAEYLLEKGANANAVTAEGYIPLQYTFITGENSKMAALLLRYSADPNREMTPTLEAKHKITPFFYTIMKGYVETADLMLANKSNPANPDAPYKNKTPLFRAVELGNIPMVTLLIRHDANMDTHNGNINRSPLHQAVAKGHAEAVRILLKSGADQTILDNWNITPIQLAGSKGQIDVLKAFVDCSANLNLGPSTPLHKAIQSGHAQAAILLIENGADIHALDSMGWTPLHRAVANKKMNVFNLLIERGAKAEESMIAIALEEGSREIYNILIGMFPDYLEKRAQAKKEVACEYDEYVINWIEEGKRYISNRKFDEAQIPLEKALNTQIILKGCWDSSLIPLYQQLLFCRLILRNDKSSHLSSIKSLLEKIEKTYEGTEQAWALLQLGYYYNLADSSGYHESDAKHFLSKAENLERGFTAPLQEAIFFGALGVARYNLLDMVAAIKHLKHAVQSFRLSGDIREAKYKRILERAEALHQKSYIEGYKLKRKEKFDIVDLSNGFEFEIHLVIAVKKRTNRDSITGVRWDGDRVRWTETTRTKEKYDPSKGQKSTSSDTTTSNSFPYYSAYHG